MKNQEERLQIECVRWFDMQYPEYRLLLHHSPNGGWRTAAEGSIFKRMGVRAGFPDIVLLLPTDEYTLLAIEMKADKGSQRPSQKEWQRVAEKYGIHYEVCRSFDEFYAVITKHIEDYKNRKK